MIKVMNKGHRSVPVICCDACGSRIDDADAGAAVFRKTTGADDISEVLHAHKGRCHVVAEEQFGGQVKTGWHELRQHLQLLAFNTGLPPAALQKLEDDNEL